MLSRTFLVLLATAALLALAVPAGTGAVRGCGPYATQAEAQDRFVALGGSPKNPIGRMDPDRDGVACEGLPGPYKGWATVGYFRKGGFFYGVASMPTPAAGDGYPCLYGNRHFPDGPRLLNVYRAGKGVAKPLFGKVGAEARPDNGRLVWKAPRGAALPGRYYAEFTAKIPMTPYGPNECPGFRSRTIVIR